MSSRFKLTLMMIYDVLTLKYKLIKWMASMYSESMPYAQTNISEFGQALEIKILWFPLKRNQWLKIELDQELRLLQLNRSYASCHESELLLWINDEDFHQ